MLLALLFATASAGETQVTVHLDTTLARLQAASVDHLSPDARARRASLLEALESYTSAGQFPLNTDDRDGRAPPTPVEGGMAWEPGRTPVFVDATGSHCAVGYLLAVDGRDDLVRDIVDTRVTGYVSELVSPALEQWATHNGFTLEELGQIQPSYGWIHRARQQIDALAETVEATKTCDPVFADADLLGNFGQVVHGQDGVESTLPASIRACLLERPSKPVSLAILVTAASPGYVRPDAPRPDDATCAEVTKVFEARTSKKTPYEETAKAFLARCTRGV